MNGLTTLVAGCTLTLIAYAFDGHADEMGYEPPFTTDHMLAVEHIEGIAVDPAGTRAAYIYAGPYEDRERSPAKAPKGQLMVVDWVGDRPLSARRILPHASDDEWSSIVGFSPTGQRLAFYHYDPHATQDLRLGVYEFASDRLIWMPDRPHAFIDYTAPVWATDQVLVYNADDKGDLTPPLPQEWKAALMRRVQGGWAAAIAGEESTASTYYSQSLEPRSEPECRRGELVRFDVSNGTRNVLLTHAVDGLMPVGDGEHLVGMSFCGYLPSMGKRQDSKSAHWLFRPTIVETREGGRTFYPCSDCNAKFGSLHIAPDRTEIAFISFGKRGTRDDTVWFRYDIERGRSVAIATPSIIPKALDPLINFNFGSPILWLGGDLVIQASANARQIPRSNGSVADATRSIRRDWYRVRHDGALINLTADLKEVPDLPLASDGKTILMSLGNRLWSIDAAGRRADVSGMNLAELAPLPSEMQVESVRTPFGGSWVPSRYAYFEELRNGARSLHRYDLQSEGWQQIGDMPASHQVVSLSTRHSLIAWREARDGSTAYGVSRVRTGLDQSAAHAIQVLNGHLRSVQKSKELDLRFVGPDNVNHRACMLLPADWEPGKIYPAIVDVYPVMGADRGCADSLSQVGFDNANLFVARGYAYLFVGAGESFRSPLTGEFADSSRWVLPAVESAVRQGYVDGGRVGLYGMSQGGFYALDLLTRTGFFRAAVAAQSTVNYASLWGGSTFGGNALYFGTQDYNSFGQMGRFEDPGDPLWLGATPWEQPESFIKITPLFRADRIRTPLLLIKSDLDSFDAGGFFEILTALNRLERPVGMAYYKGELHGLSSPANIRDAHNRVLDWFDHYLKAEGNQGRLRRNSAR